MATSFTPHVHHSFESQSPSGTFKSKVSSHESTETSMNTSSQSTSSTHGYGHGSRQGRLSEPNSASALTDLVRSTNGTGGMSMSRLMGTDHESLLEWIRAERMRKLPAEGSAYDKVLICARLFVERLHLFEGAVGPFAEESRSASQLAFIHCAGLLSVRPPFFISG